MQLMPSPKQNDKDKARRILYRNKSTFMSDDCGGINVSKLLSDEEEGIAFK